MHAAALNGHTAAVQLLAEAAGGREHLGTPDAVRAGAAAASRSKRLALAVNRLLRGLCEAWRRCCAAARPGAPAASKARVFALPLRRASDNHEALSAMRP